MLKESYYVKIRTAVPRTAAEKVRRAMGRAGAGKQGKYENCSSSYLSVGRFTPVAGANPSIRKVGRSEKVKEEIIEMLCSKDKARRVIKALKKAHPYEEPAIDILPRLEIE